MRSFLSLHWTTQVGITVTVSGVVAETGLFLYGVFGGAFL